MTDVLVRRHRECREDTGRDWSDVSKDEAQQRRSDVTRSEDETRSRVLGRNQSC